MATEVRIPTTGNAGEDAVVVEWNAAVGSRVAAGDVLLVIETAKSTVDIESTADGVLLERFAEPGDEVAEFSVVALVGAEGEAPTAQSAPAPPAPAAAPAGAPLSSQPAAEAPDPSPTAPGRRLAVSPRARRLAAERGLDLSSVTGSGPFGRILIADLDAAAAVPAVPAAAVHPNASTASAASDIASPEEGIVVPVRGARKVTAQRMHASLAGTAQLTLMRPADGDRLLQWVDRLRGEAERRGSDVKVGVNDAVLYAVARTVGRHPAANSWFDWDGLRTFERVQLGFAVDTGQALLVPVLREAQSLSIGDLARASRAAIERAKSGKLQPEEMTGGTFTVSNLGGLGVHWFTPVLNTPQSCILGVGAAHRVLPEAPAQIPLSLTFDHRALDGAAAAALLRDIALAIESVDVLDAF